MVLIWLAKIVPLCETKKFFNGKVIEKEVISCKIQQKSVLLLKTKELYKQLSKCVLILK